VAGVGWIPAFAGTSGSGAILAVSLLIAGASTAFATGTVTCETAEGGAGLELTIGTLPVLGVVSLSFTDGERTWSTGPDGDVSIVVGQAFEDGDRWLIDATDPNIEGVVGEIRLNEAIEGGDMALAGTLRIPGSAAFAVTCIGP
jgi:hypothetical protein